MSLLKLSQFSYNRKERLLKDGKENHVSENRYVVENKLNLTPNKATMTATTIPETPDSLIAVSPNAEEPRHKESTTSFRQRQRRRHRLTSSSDEDDGASSASQNAPAVNGSCPKVLCNMFSGLPSSKRRKRTESNSEDQYICPRRAIPIQSNVGEKLREYEFDESISDIKLKPHSKALRNGYSKDKLHSKDLQQLCSVKESPPRRSSRRIRRCRLADSDSSMNGSDSSDDLPSVDRLISGKPPRPVARRKQRNKRCRIDSPGSNSDDETVCSVVSIRKGHSSVGNSESDDGDINTKAFTLPKQKKSQQDPEHVTCPLNSGPSSSGWLSKPHTKLQQFAFQKTKHHRKNQTEKSMSNLESSEISNQEDPGLSTPVIFDSDSVLCVEGTHDSVGIDSIQSLSMESKAPLCEETETESQKECTTQSSTTSSTVAHPQGRTSGPTTGGESPTLTLEELEDACSDDSRCYDSDDGYSYKQRKAILEFLDQSTLEEMCNMPNCSITKAKLLEKHRPFASWDALVETLLTCKGLSEQILDGCLRLLAERRVFARLLSKCRTISASIQQHLSRMNENSAKGNVAQCFSQPTNMNSSMQLKAYQLVGLNWLALLHSQNLNGILADEMGLGKTIQAISFLAHLVENGCTGPFLIVVPSSTLDNWSRELETWCPTLNVATYWGSQLERDDIRYDILCGKRECDVILTTYNMCIGQVEDRKFFRKLSLQCLILDEGHMLKNMASQRYNHLMRIKAKRRMLLTGTPLQNDLLELMSLLSFVMPEVFQEHSDQIKKTFSRARKPAESSAYYQEQVCQAKQIMQPFILRRLKSEVLQQLPSKLERVEHCQLTELQQQLYSGVMEKSKKELKTVANSSSDTMHKSLKVITELRKVANHPLLVRHHYTTERLRQMSVDILQDSSHRDADPQLVFEDMTVMSDFELHSLCGTFPVLMGHRLPEETILKSGKFEFLIDTLSELKQQGDRVLLFSQFTMMMDITEAFLQQQHHAYLRLDGQTPISERQKLIDKFNKDEAIFVFLLSTKAGGLGINLTSANVVVIHDIDFNPYNDKQAEDRCHRVGQTREVNVIRLIGKGTIEEDMLQCAQMKLKLEQDINTTDEVSTIDVASLLKQGLGMM